MLSLGGSVLLRGGMWAVLVGGLGLVVAAVFHFIFRRATASSVAGTTTRLAVSLGLLVMWLVLPASFAYIGLLEGVLRASEHELSRGDFADEVFPAIGGAGADLVGTALLSTEAGGASTGSEDLTAAFRSGQRKIETSKIPELLAGIDADYVEEIAEGVELEVVDRVPFLEDGIGRWFLGAFLDGFSRALIYGAIEGGLRRQGFLAYFNPLGAVIDRLPEAAVRDGSPEDLSHSDLSTFLVEVTLGEGLLEYLIKPLCRVNQIGAMAPIVLVLLLPVLVMAASRIASGRARAAMTRQLGDV